MLDPSFVADGVDAAGRLSTQAPAAADSERMRAEQLRLGALMDSYLHFNDLWATMHFRRFTTYYFPNAGAWQWTPRRSWPDYDYDIDVEAMRNLKQYTTPVDSPAFQQVLARLRSLGVYFESTPDGLKFREGALHALDQQIDENIVNPRKHRVILAYIGPSPYYMQHLSAAEQGAYETLYERKSAVFKRHGYHVVRPRLESADYSDLVHLNTLGGNKLASVVAEEIRSQEAPR